MPLPTAVLVRSALLGLVSGGRSQAGLAALALTAPAAARGSTAAPSRLAPPALVLRVAVVLGLAAASVRSKRR